MIRRLIAWLSAFLPPREKLCAHLPVFYAVVTFELKGKVLVATVHETTRSIHRARGVAREMAAKGRDDVRVASYTAEHIHELI